MDNQDSATEAPSSPVQSAPDLKAPLSLAAGTRIQLDHRRGIVDWVRGNWVKPYDVRVRWDGEKQPEWHIFTTLERDYRQGRLKLL